MKSQIYVALSAVATAGSLMILLGAAQSAPTTIDSSMKSFSTAFNRTQTAEDALPSFLQSGGQALEGVSLDTTRSVGSHDGSSYWIGADSKGDVCLITLFDGPAELASMTCQPLTAALSRGIQLTTSSSSTTQVADVLPSGFTASGAGYSDVGNQLWVAEPKLVAGSTLGKLQAKSKSGNALVIPAPAQ